MAAPDWGPADAFFVEHCGLWIVLRGKELCHFLSCLGQPCCTLRNASHASLMDFYLCFLPRPPSHNCGHLLHLHDKKQWHISLRLIFSFSPSAPRALLKPAAMSSGRTRRVETDSLYELHLVLCFSRPYRQTTASPALLHHPLSLAICSGPELCLRKIFQRFLCIMSRKAISVHPPKSKKICHYTSNFHNKVAHQLKLYITCL